MRILIDLQGAQTGSRHRGIGRYTVSLVSEMLRKHKNHEYILLLNGLLAGTIEPLRNEFRSLIHQDNIVVWDAPGPTREIFEESSWRTTAAEILREDFIRCMRPDVVLLTTFFEGYGEDFVASIKELDKSTPIAMIFYDLIPYLYPESYLADERIARWYLRRFEQSKRADLLLCISESTQQEAILHLEVKNQKVVNISAASDNRFRELEEIPVRKREVLNRLGLYKPYLLYLSATDWRKNHLSLLEAYSKLPASVRTGHQLCLAGGLPEEHRRKFRAQAQEFGLSKSELVITDRVTDEELNLLFNLAKAFVFPSWHEGFGLPVLEAMQCGLPVIGSNVSSIPEVLGLADATFDPYDIFDMRDKIFNVLTDATYIEKLKSHGAQQVKNFSWANTAAAAIKAIEALGASHMKFQDGSAIEDVYSDKQLISAICAIPATPSDSDLIQVSRAIAQNQHQSSTPQLLVDVSELVRHDARTGIQRVVRNIVRALLLNPCDGISIRPVCSTLDDGYRYADRFASDVLGCSDAAIIDEPIEFGPGDIFLGLDLLHPQVALKNRLFYVKLREYAVKVVFVLYDMLPIKLPEYCDYGVPEGFRNWFEIVLESDGVCCISQSVANEFLAFRRIEDLKQSRSYLVSSFKLGAELDLASDGQIFESPTEPYGLCDPAKIKFLMVGTLEPRKAHAQVVAAFEMLWQEGMDVSLTIIGKKGWKADQLAAKLLGHKEFGRRLSWSEDIPDTELINIYSRSSCLIAASYGEGFGLPLVEAARHNRPIIARDIPVFREVAGEHAFYFIADRPDELAQAIKTWIRLFKQGIHPPSGELPWITWSQSAAELLQTVLSSKLV